MSDEHARILRVLDALDAFAAAIARGGADDKTELGRFVTFVREFADGRHHAKEEHVLFEAMVRNGFPRDAGPIGVMLAEHDELRALTGRMAALAGQATPWSAADRARLDADAAAYTGMLRQHIAKEDQILYPMAERALPPAAQAEVDAACAALDRAAEDDGTAPRLDGLANDLVARHARP